MHSEGEVAVKDDARTLDLWGGCNNGVISGFLHILLSDHTKMVPHEWLLADTMSPSENKELVSILYVFGKCS